MVVEALTEAGQPVGDLDVVPAAVTTRVEGRDLAAVPEAFDHQRRDIGARAEPVVADLGVLAVVRATVVLEHRDVT